MYSEFKIFGGCVYFVLMKEISDYFEFDVGEVMFFDFLDGEIFFQIEENVCGCDVFVVQLMCLLVNSNFVELFIMFDIFKCFLVLCVIVVILYYGYVWQDKKDKLCVLIMVKLVVDFVFVVGVDCILIMDVYVVQIFGYFDILVDYFFVVLVLFDEICKFGVEQLMIVVLDVGGVVWVRVIVKCFDMDLVIVDKCCVVVNQVEVMNVIGNVEGCNVVIVDDIIDMGGMFVNIVELLKDQGVFGVYVVGIYGVFLGLVFDCINEFVLDKVFVINMMF